MSKIICDICGTSYPETAEQCPICGCARDMSGEFLSAEQLDEELSGSVRGKGGRFAAANVRKRNSSRYGHAEDDEYADGDGKTDASGYDDYEDDQDEDEEEPGSNTPLVVLLIVVIVALLSVSAFIGVKYCLPKILPGETVETTTEAPTTVPEETTIPTIPCDSLALTSGVDVLLEQEGQMWLINVLALPENTTDPLLYTSSDETVVTVNETGTITAVGEGSATVTVTCGTQSIQCNVVCAFAPETTAPEATTIPEEITVPVETTEPTEPLKNVTLKVLKYKDLTFDGPNQGFTFVLDGLQNTEVKWTSMDEKIVTVDEKGFVLSVGAGKTTILCEYGDQKVEISINCRW